MKNNNKKIKLLFLIIFLLGLCFLPISNTDSMSNKKDLALNEYQKNKDSNNYSNNTVIVKINDDKVIDKIETKYSIDINPIGDDSYVVNFDKEKYSVDQIMNNLNSDNMIEYVQPDYYFNLAATPSTEQYYDNQWGIKSPSYGVDLLNLWSQITGNPSVVVAVVDTGVQYDHPDLVNNMWHNPDEISGNAIDDDNNGHVDDYYGWNFASNSSNINDNDGHGTHVAGIIGAEINDLGVAGVVPNVKIMALKVISNDGNIYLSNVTSAINYAISKGVKIFNFSFGSNDYVQSFKDLLQSKDVLFVCAAGNGGEDQIGDNNDNTPFYPASYDLNNVISVAATNSSGNLASYSNYGVNTVDVAAPGDYIYSTLNGSDYGYKSGTSMAAPFVTGLSAILYGSNTNTTISQLKNNIISGVKNLSSLNGKVFSSGLIDIKESYNDFMDVVEFDGGNGTVANPYLISTIRQLNAIRRNQSASYRLIANIDMTDYEWISIGSLDAPFTGTFDGNGYQLSNLSIDMPNDSYLGLFGYVHCSSNTVPNMYNLKLTIDKLNGKDYIGSFIGYGENVNIRNVSVITLINNSNPTTGYIGGIIGYGLNSKVTRGAVSGVINSTGDNVGGIAGYLSGNMSLSYNEAKIYGHSNVGGLVGYIIGDISDVYNLGIIIDSDAIANTGGIVGYLNGNINNSYYLGLLDINDSITYENIGLIVGNNDGGTITNSYYYNPYNILNNVYGSEITGTNIYDKQSYVGFDFTNNWSIGTTSLLPTIKNLDFNTLTDFSINESLIVNLNDDYEDISISSNPSNYRYNYLYSSDNTEIVTIDKNGLIIPKQAGTATISVYSIELNITKTINITVEDYIRGDLNNDRTVTLTDLVILRRYLAGLDTLNDTALKGADINKDNDITLTDLVRIRRYLAGLEDL